MLRRHLGKVEINAEESNDSLEVVAAGSSGESSSTLRCSKASILKEALKRKIISPALVNYPFTMPKTRLLPREDAW